MHNCEIKLVNKNAEANYVLPSGKSVALTAEGMELFSSELTSKQIEALLDQINRQLS